MRVHDKPEEHTLWLPQAEYLARLNASGHAEAVVMQFEGGKVAFTQETLGEYVKALARLDRLDNSRVLSLVQASR